MLAQFKKDLRLHGTAVPALLGIQLGAFVLGVVMVLVIMHTEEDPGAWFCMGTLIAGLVLVGGGLFLTAFGYPQEFMLALSMGRTRKAFMLSYYLRLVLLLAAGWLLVVLLHRAELLLYGWRFPLYGNEIYFSFLTDWRVLLPLFLVLPVISMFLGALYGKYGRKGLLVFYFLWLFCCFVLPRMFDEQPGEGVLDQVAVGFLWVVQRVPVGAWIGFGAVSLVVMAVFTVKFGMEQTVK